MEVQPKGFYKNFQNIQILQKIGRGAQADVYLVEEKTSQQQFAMKILRNKNLSQKQNKRIFLQVQSNYILSEQAGLNAYFPYFYGYWQSQYGMHLLFQKCDTNVQVYSQTIKNYNEKVNFAFFLLHDLINALSVLEKNKIIHRDIKLQNILIKGNKFKLADMGLARFSSRQNRLTTQIGNIMSKAPQFYSGIYDNKADVWSLGINIFYLLQNTLPFDSYTKSVLSQNLEQFLYLMENKYFSICLSPDLANTQIKKNIIFQILQKILIVNSQDRYYASQVKQQFFCYNKLEPELKKLDYCGLFQNQGMPVFQGNLSIQKIVFDYLLLYYMDNSSTQQGLLSLTTLLGILQFIRTYRKSNSKSQKMIDQPKKFNTKNIICTKIQSYIFKIMLTLFQYFSQTKKESLIFYILEKIVQAMEIFIDNNASKKQIQSTKDLEMQRKKVKNEIKINLKLPKSLKMINEYLNNKHNDLDFDQMLKIYSNKKVQEKFPLLQHLIIQAKILMNPDRQASQISKICFWKIPIDVRKICLN